MSTLPMAQIALAWVLRNPVVSAPIVGATKPQHLADAVAALDVHLADEDVRTLETPYTPRLPLGFRFRFRSGKARSMEITRSTRATGKGPADWFTGDVYVDTVTSPTGASRISASSVHFTPGARTAWHTHPNGQTIFVLEGVGRCQREGGPVEEIRPGDRVFFASGEVHWHGAAPDRFMTHIAMLEVDDEGRSANWAEHVTDEDYLASPG